MENQDTLRLLRECDAGAKMGVASIDGVLENVKNQELHDLLAQSPTSSWATAPWSCFPPWVTRARSRPPWPRAWPR